MPGSQKLQAASRLGRGLRQGSAVLELWGRKADCPVKAGNPHVNGKPTPKPAVKVAKYELGSSSGGVEGEKDILAGEVGHIVDGSYYRWLIYGRGRRQGNEGVVG